MEARSSGAERSVRTKRSGRISVSEGWNARPEQSEGNAQNKLLTFIFPIVTFLIVIIKVTTYFVKTGELMELYEVAAYLEKVGLQYMATVGLDGKPKVRPVQFMVEYDGKLWFCTNSKKSMYAELVKKPWIDLCGSKLLENEIQTAWIRLSAEAVFEENLEVKKMIMEKSAIVHELYENNAEHPLFKVFYLKNIRGSLNNLGHVNGLSERADFAKPKEFEF